MKTRWTVRAADRIAAACIAIGGVGTIFAVSAVFLFLAGVVVPLFAPGDAQPSGAIANPAATRVLYFGVDEYRVAGWSLSADGIVRAFRLDTGEVAASHPLVPADSITVTAFDLESGTFAVGRRDATVVLARIEFETDFPAVDSLPEAARALPTGAVLTDGDGIVERTDDGSFRRQRLKVSIDAIAPALSSSPARALDVVGGESSYVLAVVAENDSLILSHLGTKENEFTGEVSLSVERSAVALSASSQRVERVLVAEDGAIVYALSATGAATVLDIRNLQAPRVVATATLVAPGTHVTALAPLIGRSTVIVGASDGSVSTWFRYGLADADSSALACSRRYRGDGTPIVSVAASRRQRVFIAGERGGRVRVLQATSGKKVIDFTLENEPIEAVAFAPKNDGLLVLTDKRLHEYALDLKHPEATLGSLFLPVQYEGYPRAEHVWQSSAGTDDFEPKLGLWPLVFGTLKATFYSLLFGVPLALLGAIFTSEFVSPSMRPRIKTLIESMASLPSVVLGFLAALVIAPFVQRVVPSVMAGFITVPAVLLACAYLSQMLPSQTARRVSRYRLLLTLAVLPVAVAAAGVLGPWMERTFFGGDMMSWLAGRQGGAFGGWLVLLLPFSVAVVIVGMARLTAEPVRDLATRSTRAQIALVDLARFIIGGVATVGLAALAAGLLAGAGADPRGGLMGTYVQRNALVVGFVMGFAIIPIIYTIAEDALSAVPQHLRAASLGAGATPWQTAHRIVLPAAMSGLFSAVMIGLGRAVGETMIVLMAAGNTPVLEMNIFNGFRTLSANIAVELPEAVRNSTHYRTLFLAALILFLMTFVINTVAEIVRLRFRKRSAQL
jgi:phosphate transport system permease protein